MERDEFLKSLGLGLAMVCTGACFQSCGKGGDEAPAPANNTGGNNTGGASGKATVDISSLANVGSQTISGGVLFIRVAAENTNASFLATEPLCPHQGGNLFWQQANNRLECDNHHARFASSGAVISGPSTGDSVRALKVYSTTLTGTTLTATKS